METVNNKINDQVLSELGIAYISVYYYKPSHEIHFTIFHSIVGASSPGLLAIQRAESLTYIRWCLVCR
jgi:hypothetical protein